MSREGERGEVREGGGGGDKEKGARKQTVRNNIRKGSWMEGGGGYEEIVERNVRTIIVI